MIKLPASLQKRYDSLTEIIQPQTEVLKCDIHVGTIKDIETKKLYSLLMIIEDELNPILRQTEGVLENSVKDFSEVKALKNKLNELSELYATAYFVFARKLLGSFPKLEYFGIRKGWQVITIDPKNLSEETLVIVVEETTRPKTMQENANNN